MCQESLGTSCAGKPTCVICFGMAGTGKTTFIQVLLVMSHTAFTCGYIVLMLITQRLTAHLHSVKSPPYVINLDPAVHHVPYPANIGDQLNTLILLLIIIIIISLSLSFFHRYQRHSEVQTGDVSIRAGTQRRYHDIAEPVFHQVWSSDGVHWEMCTRVQVCSQTSYIASTVLHDLSSFSRYVLLDTPGQIEVFTWSVSGAIIMETLVCGPPQHIGYNLLEITRIAWWLLSHVTNTIQFVPTN